MSLDISYQGLPLLRQTSGRFEDGGLFVPSDAPMPVATALSLRYGDHQLAAKVRRVREGSGAGMLIVAGAGGKLPRWLIDIHPESAATASELFEAPAPPPAPPVVEAPAASPPSEAPAEAAPSTHTPDSESDSAAGASDDDDDAKSAAKPGDGKKPAAAAKKPGKKPRKR